MRYWVVGEFGSGDEVKKALRRLRELGYAKETLDVFSPYPVEGIDEVLELAPSPIRGFAFVAGLTGAAVIGMSDPDRPGSQASAAMAAMVVFCQPSATKRARAASRTAPRVSAAWADRRADW